MIYTNFLVSAPRSPAPRIRDPSTSPKTSGSPDADRKRRNFEEFLNAVRKSYPALPLSSAGPTPWSTILRPWHPAKGGPRCWDCDTMGLGAVHGSSSARVIFICNLISIIYTDFFRLAPTRRLLFGSHPKSSPSSWIPSCIHTRTWRVLGGRLVAGSTVLPWLIAHTGEILLCSSDGRKLVLSGHINSAFRYRSGLCTAKLWWCCDGLLGSSTGRGRFFAFLQIVAVEEWNSLDLYSVTSEVC